MYQLQLFKSAPWVEYIYIYIYIYICGNRISLAWDSEFHASAQSSGIQFHFYLP